jgi:hypothetical protein
VVTGSYVSDRGGHRHMRTLCQYRSQRADHILTKSSDPRAEATARRGPKTATAAWGGEWRAASVLFARGRSHVSEHWCGVCDVGPAETGCWGPGVDSAVSVGLPSACSDKSPTLSSSVTDGCSSSLRARGRGPVLDGFRLPEGSASAARLSVPPALTWRALRRRLACAGGCGTQTVLNLRSMLGLAEACRLRVAPSCEVSSAARTGSAPDVAGWSLKGGDVEYVDPGGLTRPALLAEGVVSSVPRLPSPPSRVRRPSLGGVGRWRKTA